MNKYKTNDITQLAALYGWQVDFVEQIASRIDNPNDLWRACQMFAAGKLPYDMATGKEPINVAEYRSNFARALLENRRTHNERIREAMEQQRKIVEYLSGCKRLTYKHKGSLPIYETVFIKDGLLVAFAHDEPKQGGIYAANNETMPNFRWHPHECLARLRKINKSFYRKIKKASVNSPREWFDFNAKQI